MPAGLLGLLVHRLIFQMEGAYGLPWYVGSCPGSTVELNSDGAQIGYIGVHGTQDGVVVCTILNGVSQENMDA